MHIRGFRLLTAWVSAFFALALPWPAPAQDFGAAQWLRFSGYTWNLRQSEEPGGPMGNRFAGQGRSVILNPDKSLTLTLSKSDGLWYCGELNLTRNLGYGTYLFKVRTRLSDLDRNLVLGLFTYSDRDTRNYDEIDIEFSAWASPKNPVRGQYIVQPYEKPGHIAYFDLKGDEERNTYSFSWTKKSIEFLSWKGYGQRPEEGSPAILAAWVFDETKQLPSPSRAGVIINLYLSGKPAPEGSGLISVIIDAFEFVKAK